MRSPVLLISLFLCQLTSSSHKGGNHLHSTTHKSHGPARTLSVTPQTATKQTTILNQVGAVPPTNKHPPTSYFSHLNLSRAAEKDVSSCFGKIKISLSLNPQFRTQFNSIVKISRIDQLENLIGRKVNELCTHEERIKTQQFMRLFQSASNIANEVYQSLTNDERDHLNVWSNLNDTDSEQKFYLAKFNSLPVAKYEEYKAAYNILVRRLLNSTVKTYHVRFISRLSEKDFKQMETFAREDEFDSIRRYICEKLKDSKLKTAQKNEIEMFFSNVYAKTTIAVGTGTRQYELRRGNSDEEEQL